MRLLFYISLFLLFSCNTDEEIDISENRVYVTLQGMSHVAIVETNNLQTIEEVSIDLSDNGMMSAPHDVAVDNVNNFWFTTAMMGGKVGMYSSETNELLSSFQINQMPALLSIDIDNKTLYVSRGVSGNGIITNIIYELSYANGILEEIEKWDVGFDYAHGIHFDNVSGNLFIVSKTNDFIAKINPNEPQVPFQNPLLISMDEETTTNHTIPVNRLRPIHITSKYPYIFITCSAGEWSSESEYEEIPGQVQMWDIESMNLLAVAELGTYSSPWHLDISPIEDKIFISMSGGEGENGSDDSGVACLQYSNTNDQFYLEEVWQTKSPNYGEMHGLTVLSDCNGNYYVYASDRTNGNIYKFDPYTGIELDSKNLMSMDMGTMGNTRTGGIDIYSPCKD